MTPMRRLREATNPIHQAFEASDWLARATADRAAYAAHLHRVAAVYRPIERAFRPFDAELDAAGFMPQSRRRLAAIEAELRDLAEHSAGAPFERDAGIPEIADLASVIGCAYVLEGSTMGGMLIAKVLRDRFAWESAFYAGYGQQTMPMWRAFTAAVDALGERLDGERLAESAIEMFAAYGRAVGAGDLMRERLRA